MLANRWRARFLRVICFCIIILPIFSVEADTSPYFLMLPLVYKRMPPPVLLPIIDDLSDVYDVSWTESPRLAVDYELQKSQDRAFTIGVKTVGITSAQSLAIWGAPDGTWFYRVRGRNAYGVSEWSNVQSKGTLLCGGSYQLPTEQVLWNMHRLLVPMTWPCVSLPFNDIIAIIDTGADSDHVDLQGNLVGGWNTILNTANTEDDNGHGTHVAGIAAGVVNNKNAGGYIFGVAPEASIMPVKVLDANGQGYTSDIAEGIIWAVDHGAGIINLSLGGFTPSEARYDAVRYAYEHDVVIITSAGNCGEGDPSATCPSPNAVSYPAAYTETLAVAATNEADARAAFSSAGSWVDLAAPGDDIASSFPCILYEGYWYCHVYMSGTSMAAPHVAGVAALVRHARPTWSNAQVYYHLVHKSTQDLGAPGYDPYFGWGRVNAWEGLKNAILSEPVPPALHTAEAGSTYLGTAGVPTEFRPGAVLFKLREGASLAAVTGAAGVQSAGLGVQAVVEELGVLELQVPAGEEAQWLAYLRGLPEVEYAELDGVVRAY